MGPCRSPNCPRGRGERQVGEQHFWGVKSLAFHDVLLHGNPLEGTIFRRWSAGPAGPNWIDQSLEMGDVREHHQETTRLYNFLLWKRPGVLCWKTGGFDCQRFRDIYPKKTLIPSIHRTQPFIEAPRFKKPTNFDLSCRVLLVGAWTGTGVRSSSVMRLPWSACLAEGGCRSIECGQNVRG